MSKESSKNRFSGKAFLVDRSDVNTDEIIPAKYLTEITRIALKPYLFEDLKVEKTMSNIDYSQYNVVISRDNFGCGSSREHAVWVLEANGIYTVIAESFSRIFRQNMFNCGLLAVELDHESIDKIFQMSKEKDVFVNVNLEEETVLVRTENWEEVFKFQMGSFERALVQEQGWVNYADKRY